MVGEGKVNINTLALETNAGNVYLDTQIFKYKPKQAGKVKKMNITVALIASGADGCSRAKPITPESCFNLTMAYLHAAGEMGVDLAVLPENWSVYIHGYVLLFLVNSCFVKLFRIYTVRSQKKSQTTMSFFIRVPTRKLRA